MRITLPSDRSAKKKAHQKIGGQQVQSHICGAALYPRRSKLFQIVMMLYISEKALCASFQAGSRTSESSVTVAGQCRTLRRFENRTTTGLSPLCAVHPGDQHTQNDWYSIQLIVS